jgi:hypothetical protein
MKILALDIATRTGYAWGPPGMRPEYGSRRLAESGADEGKIFSLFAGWLAGMITEHQITHIYAEAAYVPQPRIRFKKAGDDLVPGAGSPPFNIAVIKRLIGLRAVAQLIKYRYNIEYREVESSAITRHFTGFGRHGGREGKKAATMAMARLYGFTPANDDESDALSLFFYAESILAPLAQRSAGPLFVDLRG